MYMLRTFGHFLLVATESVCIGLAASGKPLFSKPTFKDLFNDFKHIFMWSTISKYCTHFTDDFVLTENSQIDLANTYNGHDELITAKTSCLIDKHCIGIYDASCDKNGPFMLLKYSFMTSVYGKSCIYRKTRYGRHSLYLYHWILEHIDNAIINDKHRMIL